jgi:hypothetical protein
MGLNIDCPFDRDPLYKHYIGEAQLFETFDQASQAP